MIQLVKNNSENLKQTMAQMTGDKKAVAPPAAPAKEAKKVE